MLATRVTAGLLATAALAACSRSESENARGSPRGDEKPRTGRVVVAEGARRVDAAYVAGNRLFGIPGAHRRAKLAASINGLLIATLSPAAVPDPRDNHVVAYNSWRRRSPVIRVHEVASGKDRILDRGAYSIAWRREGALAYFKALKPDLDPENVRRYFGHVVVRSSEKEAPVRWTAEPGVYVVAAWAGDHLLVYRIGKKWPDLLVLDGRARVRLLSRAGALVAVSPDGRRAFVSEYGASPPVVRVLNVADGTEAAQFVFEKKAHAAGGEAVRWLTESGSWVGDNVFAASSVGLLVFRVGAAAIELEQTLRFDMSAFPLGLFEPQGDESGRRVAMWGQLVEQPRQAIPDAAVVECDRVTLRCEQGPVVSSAIGPRLVYNPSGP